MKQVIQAVLGIVCVAIIAELALRLLAGFSQNIRFFTTNPYQQTYFAEDTGWQGVTVVAYPKFFQYPGAELNGFILNSHGFLNPEYPYKKPANTKRIVFLGDSQTLGEVPYQYSFVRQIESRFQAEQKNVQTINLGVICIGPGMEKQIFIHEGAKFQPNVVVLGFFVGNDFTDDMEIINTYRLTKEKKHLFPFWVYQSRLYSLIRNMRLYLVYGKKSPLLQKVNIKEVGIANKDFTDDMTKPTFTESDYLALATEKARLFSPASYVYVEKDTVLKHIADIKQLVEQTGAKFIVLIIPDELQINTSLREQVNKKTPIDPATIALPQSILKNFFDEQNIAYIDLLSLWEASPAAQHYFRLRDTHLNIEGNQAVTDILYPKLQELVQ